VTVRGGGWLDGGVHLRTLVPVVAFTLAAAVLAGCGGDDGEAQLAGLRRDPPLEASGVVLPQVAPDGTETPFELKAAPGRMLAVYFGYTNCPDLCPTTMADLRIVKEELGDRADTLDVALVTVDPERDTPEVLSGYLGSFFEEFPDTRLHPLRTEDVGALEQAENAFLATSTVQRGDAGEVEVAHSATLYLVDDTGTVVIEWPFGTSWRAMSTDISQLLGDL
jgi:protein SCO1